LNREAARDRLILALDVGGEVSEALSWVDNLKEHVGMFKIGKEAFTAFGPEIVKSVEAKGGKVFLDLKFHDIPNTVAGAARAATKLGVSMFNVHALGGRKMMEEAVRSARAAAGHLGFPMPMVLAVTVLTSLNDADMKDMGFHDLSARHVAVHLARLAKDAGLSGVVASAQEIDIIREACGGDFIIVAPGIRTGGEVPGDDQKRILTPEEAVRRGADFLVVGRPITGAVDPAAAADNIVNAIAAGLATRTKS
jgi:orotidine-5'-phosphate decarboxylase